MSETLIPNQLFVAKAKAKEKAIQEYFIFEMKSLLKKYNAEIMVETPDGPMFGCDAHIAVIIHSKWNQEQRLSETISFSLGNRV